CVTSTGGVLSARVGDMMYIRPDSSPFAADAVCKELPTSGNWNGDAQYWGYPVIDVIDSFNIIVIGPNITTFNTTTLTRATDLVFIPAIWNEKNIRTNRAEGANFEAQVNGGHMTATVKKVGGGMMSVFVQNSSTEATDDMRLDEMGVSTDDWVVFGADFALPN